jgi:hypothetical protein
MAEIARAMGKPDTWVSDKVKALRAELEAQLE